MTCMQPGSHLSSGAVTVAASASSCLLQAKYTSAANACFDGQLHTLHSVLQYMKHEQIMSARPEYGGDCERLVPVNSAKGSIP